MPGIEESDAAADSEFSRNVEVLVQEIKENLRLGALKPQPAQTSLHFATSNCNFATSNCNFASTGCSSLAMKSLRRNKTSRPTPYHVPSRSRSWGDSGCDDCGHSKAKNTPDDPYEMLQELLRDGALIKEAVRRLEIGLQPKKRYLYDSDEECRTPLRLCNVDA